MAMKCIKCEHLSKDRESYPCNSCKELDSINRTISHFKERSKDSNLKMLKRKNKN